MGQPEDLMGAVTFLSSDASGYVTGACVLHRCGARLDPGGTRLVGYRSKNVEMSRCLGWLSQEPGFGNFSKESVWSLSTEDIATICGGPVSRVKFSPPPIFGPLSFPSHNSDTNNLYEPGADLRVEYVKSNFAPWSPVLVAEYSVDVTGGANCLQWRLHDHIVDWGLDCLDSGVNGEEQRDGSNVGSGGNVLYIRLVAKLGRKVCVVSESVQHPFIARRNPHAGFLCLFLFICVVGARPAPIPSPSTAEPNRVVRAGRTARGQCNRGIIAGGNGRGERGRWGAPVVVVVVVVEHFGWWWDTCQDMCSRHVHSSHTLPSLPPTLPIQALAGGQRGNVLEGWEIGGQIPSDGQMGRWGAHISLGPRRGGRGRKEEREPGRPRAGSQASSYPSSDEQMTLMTDLPAFPLSACTYLFHLTVP
jgi:hypothetical protein